MLKKSLLVVICAGALFATGCSNSAVQRRQEAVSGAQSSVLENRATRLEARDQRMNASREAWLE